MRRGFWGFLVAVIALMPLPPARASVPVVIIEGRGFGHGVGMAQDGAFWMAKAGATMPQILGHFYPGTTLAKVTRANVRVAVYNAPAATIAFPKGGRIDERGTGAVTPGFPIRVDPGGAVRMQFVDGRIVVDQLQNARAAVVPTSSTSTSTTRATPSTVATARSRPSLFPTSTTTSTAPPRRTATPVAASPAPPSTPRTVALTPDGGGTVTVVDRQRTYRGVIEASHADAGVRLVNQLDIEQYLRGMGEVRDPTWPAAALRTQAVAARTYALRAMNAAGELCDGTRCQVYLGKQAEYPAMDKAVAATTGQVLAFNHALAAAVYSSNGGGHSASREEGFGTTGGDYPYLRAAPYETQNPMPWTVVVGLADIAARFGGSAVTSVRVDSAGPSGRAMAVSLVGPGGTRPVTGRAFAAGLGLRSTMFTMRMGTADVAPPPPTDGAVLQSLPDEVALVDTPTVAAPPVALAMDLPDRPHLARRVNAQSAPHTSVRGALVQLTLAVALIAAAGTRRRRRPIKP